ncbi:TetR/AcrR family transcriptional regulator [Nocardiopsis quinghaiensis]|uniref:TetR/AcrR family transcriptional regulator n=1 Tax=Nocardiopsis quinghaiensis TaxID=464995 RepID=UPI00123B1022|nr:TetR/AcrR family transcriptional regulator [Nocardiopsis quinghaiensis]
MGRPSKAAERTEQILDAVGRCIVRYGMDGWTLERVAKEADLSRSLVRHFVGNRDELSALFRERILTRYGDMLGADDGGRPPTEVVLEKLFSPSANLDDYAAIDAILASARYQDGLREEARDIYLRLEAAIARAMAHDNPGWGAQRVQGRAHRLLLLAFGHWSMTSLGFPADRTEHVLTAARELLGLPQNTPSHEEPCG